MKFDMHVHTSYSDALNTPEEAVRAAIKKGLDGMAVTDHDNVKGSLVAKEYAKTYKKGFKVITGAEVSSLKGHILALGVKENVKPLLPVEETVEKIHDLGGIAVAAHPFQLFSKKSLAEEAIKADAIEVLNSGNIFMFLNRRASEFAQKNSMPVCAGSDSHSMISIGNAGIICDGDPLNAIMKHKVKIFGRRTPYIVMAWNTFFSLPKFIMLKRELPSF